LLVLNSTLGLHCVRVPRLVRDYSLNSSPVCAFVRVIVRQYPSSQLLQCATRGRILCPQRSTYPYRPTPVDRRSHENRPYYKHPEMVFLPSRTPVEGIIRIIRRLRYENNVVSCAVTGSMLESRDSLRCGGDLSALLFALVLTKTTLELNDQIGCLTYYPQDVPSQEPSQCHPVPQTPSSPAVYFPLPTYPSRDP